MLKEWNTIHSEPEQTSVSWIGYNTWCGHVDLI